LKRQQAEQKIIEQAALIDIATDAIFVHDLDDTILFWSKGAERLYGWTEAEVLGKKSQSLFNQDPKQAKILGQAQQKAIAEGSWTGELEQITKEGKKIIVVSRKTRIEYQFSQSQAILVVNSDITQKKQLEKQFYHAQRLEGLGALASGIAHDFNNILTPILGASQLLTLRLVEPDESIERLLSLLTNSARRGADLVKQILLFGRNTEGQVIVLQLGYVLKELIAVAQQTFPKSITILSEISTERLWKISADSIQMHQVFLNLMVNARDSMPNGGTLTICAENLQLTNQTSVLEKAGDYVRVTVTDTGQGIPPEFLEQIFDPFFTTKEVGKGTGLGLSTVIGIIKDHGGFIKVDSELGKGTTFHVFLPTIAEEADLATQKEKKRKERAALPKGQGELVLIVDDEAFIREVAKTALQNYNYQTMLAGDGLEAISLYQEHQQKINVAPIQI
jgi:two-component system cell cycle sensor histidine kinase/response regulator CckA